MRRIVFFILILQFSSGHLLGVELMKMPFLVSHFKVYQGEHPEKTWFDFFCLHYTDSTHRQADPAHKHLPLQSVSVNGSVYMLPSGYPATLTCKRPDTDNAGLPASDETLLPSDFRMRLLRPPRV